MRGRTRRVGVAVALVAVAVLGSACSGTPTEYGPCHHVVVHPARRADVGGYWAAFDWEDVAHSYGESATLTVCLGAVGADTAAFEPLPGVTVTPDEQPIGFKDPVVLSFDVTVDEGGEGRLRLRLLTKSGHTFAEPRGPEITRGVDGWRFTSPDRS